MENGERRVGGDSNCAGRAGLLMAAPFFPVLPTRRRFLSLLFLSSVGFDIAVIHTFYVTTQTDEPSGARAEGAAETT